MVDLEKIALDELKEKIVKVENFIEKAYVSHPGYVYNLIQKRRIMQRVYNRRAFGY